MDRRTKNVVIISLFAIYIIIFSGWLIIKKDVKYSASERRNLTQKPVITVDNVMNGQYMSNFDKYVTDQFPARETFRKINSWILFNTLFKKDVNNIYVKNGYAAKIEDTIDYKSVNWGIDRMRYICEKYTDTNTDSDKNNRVYMCIIPDKNYYLTDGIEYPYLDYADFVGAYREGMDGYAQYIDISKILDITNYYKTDLHWKQETLINVADKISDDMFSGNNVPKSNEEVRVNDKNDNRSLNRYTVNVCDNDFYGVYYGQMALDMKPDVIKYLTNSTIENYKVTCYDTGQPVAMPVYDMNKAYGKDPYEMYLGGSLSLISIDNENIDTDRRLIIFRDSFGSAIAPVLAEKYKETVLVDIRYISPANIGRYVDFNNADVLFMYSEQVLNSCADQFKK